MALSASRLGNAMAAASKSVYENISKETEVPQSELDDIWKAAAQTIIDEITGNAQVIVPAGSSAGTYSVI